MAFPVTTTEHGGDLRLKHVPCGRILPTHPETVSIDGTCGVVVFAFHCDACNAAVGLMVRLVDPAAGND